MAQAVLYSLALIKDKTLAKFPIVEARPELGFTPSTAVRADIDVGQGDVGGAIGQALLAGATEVSRGLQRTAKEEEIKRLREEKIREKRRQMQDANSAVIAKKLRSTADAEYEERVLEDDYPMHHGYLYVVVVPSGEQVPFKAQNSQTVGQYKAEQKFDVDVMNCDIKGRDLWEHTI